jgi:hypothetical protein
MNSPVGLTQTAVRDKFRVPFAAIDPAFQASPNRVLDEDEVKNLEQVMPAGGRAG